jgi:NTE family protein
LASCAIPGYFRPVTIAGTEYLDGGVHSATNADVLKADGLDLVIIVSSLSAADGRANGFDGLVRRAVHRRMAREIARLEEAGTAVISLEPGADSRRAMGLQAMAENRGPRIIEVAYEETRRRILSSGVLAGLGTPSGRPATAAG